MWQDSIRIRLLCKAVGIIGLIKVYMDLSSIKRTPFTLTNLKSRMVFHINSKWKHLVDTNAISSSFVNVCKTLKFYVTCIQILQNIFLYKKVNKFYLKTYLFLIKWITISFILLIVPLEYYCFRTQTTSTVCEDGVIKCHIMVENV